MSDNNFDIQISVSAEIPDIQIECEGGGSGSYPDYEGEYEVESRVGEEQILPTRNKVMRDDLTVNEVPVFAVGNPSGGYTYYIGR